MTKKSPHEPDFSVKDGDTLGRLRDLFDQIIDVPVDERSAWLAYQVPDHEERHALARLLAADEGDGFLDMPATEHAALLAAEEVGSDGLIGQQIGEFRLVRALGRGGMATVFLGSRVGKDFEQQVAVKLLRRGLYSELEQRLFLRERQLLAALSHPNIARLIDGGVTAAGIPYLVMEHIDGVPITRYASERMLDVRARVKLFLDVCRAVEAAHHNLIVHRDIKPSNVMVDTRGTVKLLDFGIAKLIEDDADSATIGVFTPDYAAPEQLNGGAITTATDVYSLGVMLHELLTGFKPSGQSPKRPSSLAGRSVSGGDSQPIPIAVPRLRRLLRGDLDNIVLKALAHEPGRRYTSASAFADDIERYLDRLPVNAHPPSRLYKTKKFIQRHRGGVLLTLAFLLAILAALGLAIWQGQVARHEAQRANSVRNFLVSLFDAARAELPRNQRPTPEYLVEAAIKRAHDDASLDAGLRADLLRTLGTVSLSMGNYAQAEVLLDEAIKREQELGVPPSSPEWIDTLVQKGNLLQRTNRNTQADQLMQQILPELRRQDSEIALFGLMLYSGTRLYSGHADEGQAIAAEVAAKAARFLPADSLDAAKAATFPGQFSVIARRDKDSVALLEPAIARWRKLGVPLDDSFAQVLNNFAVAKERTGDVVAAEALYREGIALRRRIFDGPHDELATALEKFAIFLTKHEEFDEAQSLLNEALEMNRTILGPESSEVASTLDSLGVLEGSRREFAASETHLREAVALYTAHAASTGDADSLAITRNHLAQTLVEQGKTDEAGQLNAAAVEAVFKSHGENSDLLAGTLVVTGRIVMARGDPKSALESSDRAAKILAHVDVPNPRPVSANHHLRAQILQALGRSDEALAEANEALRVLQTTFPEAHARQAAVLALRARIQRALGKSDDATRSIADARALNVSMSMLAPEDVGTLGPAAR